MLQMMSPQNGRSGQSCYTRFGFPIVSEYRRLFLAGCHMMIVNVYIHLLHDEAIHQRKQLGVISANALDNAQSPYLEVYNALFVL